MLHRVAPAVGRAAAAASLLISALGLCGAQPLFSEPGTALPRLVNIDAVTPLPEGVGAFHIDARLFGSEEDITYTTLAAGYGISSRADVMLRCVLAGTRTYPLAYRLSGPGGGIRHGGTDVEVLLRCNPYDDGRTAYLLGVAFPNTPAQDEPVLTAQALYAIPVGATAVALNARAALVRHSPLVGLGAGGALRLSDTVTLKGDLTFLVCGDDTRSVFTGERIRGEVWGVGLAFGRLDDESAPRFEVGVTTGTGGTTGFSLTPGLSGTTAFYLGVSGRW